MLTDISDLESTFGARHKTQIEHEKHPSLNSDDIAAQAAYRRANIRRKTRLNIPQNDLLIHGSIRSSNDRSAASEVHSKLSAASHSSEDDNPFSNISSVRGSLTPTPASTENTDDEEDLTDLKRPLPGSFNVLASGITSNTSNIGRSQSVVSSSKQTDVSKQRKDIPADKSSQDTPPAEGRSDSLVSVDLLHGGASTESNLTRAPSAVKPPKKKGIMKKIRFDRIFKKSSSKPQLLTLPTTSSSGRVLTLGSQDLQPQKVSHRSTSFEAEVVPPFIRPDHQETRNSLAGTFDRMSYYESEIQQLRKNMQDYDELVTKDFQLTNRMRTLESENSLLRSTITQLEKENEHLKVQVEERGKRFKSSSSLERIVNQKIGERLTTHQQEIGRLQKELEALRSKEEAHKHDAILCRECKELLDQKEAKCRNTLDASISALEEKLNTVKEGYVHKIKQLEKTVIDQTNQITTQSAELHALLSMQTYPPEKDKGRGVGASKQPIPPKPDPPKREAKMPRICGEKDTNDQTATNGQTSRIASTKKQRRRQPSVFVVEDELSLTDKSPYQLSVCNPLKGSRPWHYGEHQQYIYGQMQPSLPWCYRWENGRYVLQKRNLGCVSSGD